jgi:hypothetical protein
MYSRLSSPAPKRIDRATQEVWWLSPTKVTLYFILPIYVACVMMQESFYWQFGIRQKYLNGWTVFLGAACLLAFALGSFLSEYGRGKPVRTVSAEAPRLDPRMLGRCLLALYGLTFVGYVLLLSPLLQYPDLLAQHWAGSDRAQYLLRTYLVEQKSIGATLISLQAFAIVLTFAWTVLTSEKAIPRSFLILAAALAAICVFRAWVWSERLAVIEIILPAHVIHVGRIMTRKGLLVRSGPLLGIIALVFLFGIGEYFRSWQIYQHQGYSLGHFMAARLFGYYATALNNGAAAVELLPTFYKPTATALFLDNLPFLKSDPYALTYDQSWRIFLSRYANVEFNNGSGLFAPVIDYGAALGVLVWFGLGVWLGHMSRGFREHRLWATILYPIWYVGVIEILRIFYWGDARFKIPLIAGPIVVFFLHRAAIRRRSGQSAWPATAAPAFRNVRWRY